MSDANDLVVSVVDLPAEVGAHLQKDVEWVVPEGWETEVLTHAPGTRVPLAVSLTAIDGAVLVQVSGSGTLEGACVRCLEPITLPWNVNASDIYAEEGRPGSSRKPADSDDGIETEGDEFDPERVIERNTVDLEPLLRDAIFGSAPLQPLCKKDCQGLCPHCGIRMDEAEPGHEHQFLDPRFAALEGFFDSGEGDASGE